MIKIQTTEPYVAAEDSIVVFWKLSTNKNNNKGKKWLETKSKSTATSPNTILISLTALDVEMSVKLQKFTTYNNKENVI